jgi:hypothetical protein
VASSTQSALTYSVYNAKIVIDQSLNTFSAGSNVFADTFTRANSTTVGNGWSEISVLAADAQISSNRLNFSSATDIAAVYRAGSAFSNIITTFKFNKASASDDNWTFQIRRDNTTRGQGANSLGLTVNTLTGAYTITDSGTTKSSGTIPGAPFSSGTQYSFEWVITSTNYMELRYWLTATESRPDVASATVPAFSVVTTTTNWGFVGMNNSSFADLSIDNLTTTGGTITKLEPQYLLSSVASNQASIDNSYSETNVNVGHTVNNVEISGQCFTSSGGVLRSAIFALNRTGSPTGNAFAKIYATTGSVGTTCVPTGGVLATSNGVDISTVVTTAGVYELKTFTFGGANNITLSGSTAYAVVLVYPTGDGSNYINLGGDDTASTHAGNRVGSGDAGANWFNSATQDEAFYTYVSANPPIPSSKTLWDSSEWNTTNAYIHEVDAADGSASSATIIDSGSVVVTNSTVTSPDNVGYSSSLCMPSTGDLGVNFPTNYGDITATRILVQVGGTEASCGPAAIIIAPSRLKIIKGFLNIQAGKLQIR